MPGWTGKNTAELAPVTATIERMAELSGRRGIRLWEATISPKAFAELLAEQHVSNECRELKLPCCEGYVVVTPKD